MESEASVPYRAATEIHRQPIESSAHPHILFL
jgi:hypothetical protein